MNDLFERVLIKLGLTHRPEPTPDGLAILYAAWCKRVPFDNVRKLIHVRTGDPRAFPGNTADDFFAAWLQHGTGGTCWSNAGACHALLQWLGFDAQRCIATMMVAPDIPPNHGVVSVAFDSERYVVDTSILHGRPIRLENNVETVIEHSAWGIRSSWRDGHYYLNWRPLHKTDGLECRIERFGAAENDYHGFYEQTRGWSPFNYEVNARINRDQDVTGLAFGQAVTLHNDGSVTKCAIDDNERRRILIDDFGLSEEIVSQLPVDRVTPPPPGSNTASQQK